MVGISLWASAPSIALGVFLFLSAIAFQPGVLAQTRGLGEPPMSESAYKTKISEFQSKLEMARRMQADLKHRVVCLDKRADDLVSIRNVKELELGQILSRGQQLEESVGTQQAAYDGYRKSFEEEERNLNGLRKTLHELQLRRDWQTQWIEECKREKDWKRLWGLTCEADMNIAQTFGAIKNYEGDIAGAEKRVQIARDSVQFAKQKLDQSRDQLTTTRSQAEAVREEFPRAEQAIGALRSALSQIRGFVQPFQIEIEEYANALNEARDVRVEDNRSRTVRKLSDITENIDAVINRSSDAISQTDKTLDEGWLKTCIN